MQEAGGKRGKTQRRCKVPSKEKKPSRAKHHCHCDKRPSLPSLLCGFQASWGGTYDPRVLSEFVLSHISSLVQSIHLPIEPNVGDIHLSGRGDMHEMRLQRGSSFQIYKGLCGYSGLPEPGMSTVFGVSEVDGTDFHQQCNSG